MAHIAVRCEELPKQLTQVSTAYSFVGLSEIGNQDIASMTQEAYNVKMSRCRSGSTSTSETEDAASMFNLTVKRSADSIVRMTAIDE